MTAEGPRPQQDSDSGESGHQGGSWDQAASEGPDWLETSFRLLMRTLRRQAVGGGSGWGVLEAGNGQKSSLADGPRLGDPTVRSRFTVETHVLRDLVITGLALLRRNWGFDLQQQESWCPVLELRFEERACSQWWRGDQHLGCWAVDPKLLNLSGELGWSGWSQEVWAFTALNSSWLLYREILEHSEHP